MIEIRWLGRGGQGAFTASKILGAAVIAKGGENYALSFPAFGPERRGAPIQAFTKIDNKPIVNRTEIKKCDFCVILDESLFNLDLLKDLKPDGKVILNTSNKERYKEFPSIIAIDATGLAMEILHQPITNTAMIGALIASRDIIQIEHINNSLEEYLNKKIAEKNKAIVLKVYEIVRRESDEKATA